MWLSSCLVALYLLVSPTLGNAAISQFTLETGEAAYWEYELAEEASEETPSLRKTRKAVEPTGDPGVHPLAVSALFWDYCGLWALATHLPLSACHSKPAFVPGVVLRLALLAKWRK